MTQLWRQRDASAAFFGTTVFLTNAARGPLCFQNRCKSSQLRARSSEDQTQQLPVMLWLKLD